MRFILTTTCAAALLGAGLVGAANRNSNDPSTASKEVTQDTKVMTNSGTTTTSTDTVYGRVEGYDLNKSIKVSAPGKVSSSKSFDLTKNDETKNIASGIKVGDWVKVQQTTDNNGHKTLTIEPSSERASR
jgi:hypothetical protein